MIALTLARLNNFQENYTERFLQRLNEVLEQSAMFDQNGNPLLTVQGFLWVVIKAVLDVKDAIHPGNDSIYDRAQTIVDVVDVLKEFREMRSDSARCDTILFLSSSF